MKLKYNFSLVLFNIFVISTVLSQNQGKIVYASEKSGYFEIYVHDLENNTKQQLTNRKSEMSDYAPSFSRDGKLITFISYRKDGWRSWLMDADGDNKRLANKYSTYNGWARISPDNKKMVFQSYRPGHHLYLAKSNGNNPTLLLKSIPSSKAFCANPSWAPNSKFVVFTVVNNSVLTIYKMNIETKKTTKLFTHKQHTMAPSFSPDGKRILYTALVKGVPQIFTMNNEGSNIKQLTQNSKISNLYAQQNMNDFVASRLAITASWSPDGEMIVYSKVLGKNVIELFIMDKNGNNSKQLTFDKSIATHPSWAVNN